MATKTMNFITVSVTRYTYAPHAYIHDRKKKRTSVYSKVILRKKKKKKSWVASVEGFRPGIEPGFFERQSNTLPLCERSIHMT